MCGIAGFYNRDKKGFPEALLEKAVACMHHRGPDFTGVASYENVCLGHARLKILDLSDAANQPMESADGTWSIVFNGEIYNYLDLKKDFFIETRTSSDTEIVAEMFARHGVEAVKYFRGMFAIGAFNKETRDLYIIRDRLGIKPLYVYEGEEGLAFASELKALYELRLSLNVSSRSIFDFLHLGLMPGNASIFQEISKVLPGEYFHINKEGQVRKKKYWNIRDFLRPDSKITYQSAKERLRELVFESVKYRMASDVPVGTFLSGGIDSSLITAIASRFHSNIKSFTISFPEEGVDESPYAGKVAEHLETEHHTFQVSSVEAVGYLEEIINNFDEPFADSSALPTWFVSKIAKEHVGVVLSGDGGDELFLGYNSYRWAQRLNNPLIKAAAPFLSAFLSFGSSRMKRAGKLLDFPGKEPLAYHIFSQEQYYHTWKEAVRLLKKEREPYPGLLHRDLVLDQQLFDLEHYLPEDLLTKVDRTSMEHSLEVRVPLLDHMLLEYALNLPLNYKMNKGGQKTLLKELLFEMVPSHIFNRPKWGFSIPLNKWLKNELAYLMDYISFENVKRTGVLNPEAVLILKKRYLGGEEYLYNRIWVLIVIQKFLLEKKWNYSSAG